MANIKPSSRVEAILQTTIDGREYRHNPESRIEELLLELKAVIEGGGGGGGTTDYNHLSNKPSINGHTLEGEMDSEDIGVEEPLTEDQIASLISLLS